MHSCPICFEVCYCDGEDVDVGDEEAIGNCSHCPVYSSYEEDDVEPDWSNCGDDN